MWAAPKWVMGIKVATDEIPRPNVGKIMFKFSLRYREARVVEKKNF
jgi:hypothetical protein